VSSSEEKVLQKWGMVHKVYVDHDVFKIHACSCQYSHVHGTKNVKDSP